MTPATLSGHPLITKARRAKNGLNPLRISDLGLLSGFGFRYSDFRSRASRSGRRARESQHPGHLPFAGQSGLDERPGALGQGRVGDELIEFTRSDAVTEGVVEAQPFDERQSSAITSAQASRAALARALRAPAAEQPLVKDQLQ